MEKSKSKLVWWKKLLIGIGGFFGGLILTVLTLIGSLNVLKFAIYPEYYGVRELVCTNYGLNSDYISQGTAITDDGKYIITSGYMKDKTDSRIYITEIETDKTHACKILSPKEGKTNTAHFGGVAVNDGTIYLPSGGSIYTVSFEEALNNDEVRMTKLFETHNSASFIFTESEYIYVGKFYDGADYVTENQIVYNDVEYNAIVEKYSYTDLSKPVAVYGIRNKVQGFAINEKGDILLSTSFGLTSSNFYFYKAEKIIDTASTYEKADNAPVYVLETHDKVLSGPAMSEDLDFYNGKFYTNFESACNKYIFGKFFVNANKIVALDFSKYETK